MGFEYSDLLGRLIKVEELNWNETVYSTTNYSLNVRDQLTQINQAGQTRTFSYDGYGRLNQCIKPEQGTTNYSYFADDTVQTVTDARGATSTFGYNNRGLVTSITYGVPAGVAATPNLSFLYDAAGNRTSMNDGLGSVSYVYNTLSQLTSETRTFTGVTGSFALTYGYNLAGQLNSITNPWGAQVGYGYDKTGRPTNVSGSGYAGVSSYVSSMAYRAFGLKQMVYNNGRTLSLQYDNRMRPTQWNIPGVMGWNYFYNYFGENTGRVTYAQNITDPKLDRSYHYDHVGRLQSAYTGSSARAHVGIGSNWLSDGPYAQQDNVYDVYGNTLSRTGWGGTNPQYGASYTNNKMNGMVYDNAGNLRDAGGGWVFTYDATGQQATSAMNNVQMFYDGDRLRGKKSENGTVTYYLRSSVLGGQVVAELSSGGTWLRGYVYLGGEILAVQQQAGVYWMHQDPVAKSKRVTNASGGVVSTIELDPWGGETNFSSSEAFQPRKFTTYEQDSIGSHDAMHRRYNRWWARFEQPDPYGGSYDLGDPQSFNRYSYVQNDPVNFVDPSGLRPCLPGEFGAWCDSSGYGSWGGGFDMNDRISLLGGSGRQTITEAEYDYAYRYFPENGPFRFGSAFSFSSWVGWLPQNTDLEGLDLWRAGVDELKKRIEGQDACANFFGGKEKALKALEKLKPQMGNLPSRAIAAIDGNKITLDSTRFINAGTPVQSMRLKGVEGAATIYASQTHNLSGAMFSAFIVGHEFGHKMKSYDKKNDNDKGDSFKVGLNNEQLRAACFSELAAP